MAHQSQQHNPALQAQQHSGEDQDQAHRDAEAEARERKILAGNQSLRNLVEATLQVNRVVVEDVFPGILTEVVLAGETGREVLQDMLQQAAAGKNPGPSQGELQRAFTEQDVPQLSARIVAQKKMATEAARAKVVADAAMAEATTTLANAKRIADEATAEESRLQEELQLGIERGLDQLQNAPNRGGLNAGGHGGAAVDGLGGDIFTLPARQVPANPLRPVIRLPEVNPAQPGGL